MPYMRRGYLNLASGNYTAALQLAPDLTSCWCDLANVHLKTGRVGEVIPLYLEALKLDPRALGVAHQSCRRSDGDQAISGGQGAAAGIA
jgi:predicted TPR repeat methyltransferase